MRQIIRRVFLPFSLVMLSFMLRASLPQVATGSWGPANGMSSLHDGGCVVVLQDGRILIGGGSDASGATAKVDIFNTDGSWSAAPPMLSPRTHQACAALKDGQVLIAGGTTTGGGVTNSAEMFDPGANTWSQLSPMSEARAGATTSVLQDGRVLLAGGQTTAGPSNSMEIFDPNTQTFNFAGTMSASRQDAAAVLLQDGRVLIVGGSGVDANGNAVVLGSSDIYDPGTGSVLPGPTLVTVRSKHSATMQLDGKVAVIGGNDGSNDLASIEVCDPLGAGNFNVAAASLATPRSGHLAFLLPKNNEVLVVGGQSGGVDMASAELYVPWGNQSAGADQSTGSMAAARSQASGAPLSTADGLLLVAGGSAQTSAELYSFATVTTDQSDYAPGTTVTITGGGWQPGETVTLTLVESPLIDTHPVMTAVADQNGNIFNNQFSPDSHDVNVRFYLTATGSQSQAQNTFTDGNVTSVSGTVKSSSAGNPVIVGATIRCTAGCNNTPTASTTSGPTGAYVFNNTTTKLSFNTNGPVTLALTASAPGFNQATLTLTNVNNGDTLTGKDFLLTPSGTAPNITSPNSTTFTVNSAGSFTFTATGSPAPTFSETGALPSGVTFTSAGVLSGTPALGTAGSFPITVTASNGVSPNATQSFTLMVGKATATVTLNNLSQTYTGSPEAASATTNPTGLTVNFTYNGSTTAPTNAGSYTVVGTINDTNYQGSATGTLVIDKATPTITWSHPSDISYPTALDATQLNATANVPGSFVYAPASGTVLNAGVGQTLSVAFTPTDTTDYTTASKSVVINVLPGTVTITWAAPSDIVYGTALSATQLNATASVPGTFAYSPAAGTVLNAGNAQQLSVTFTPTDTTNYASAVKSVAINVSKANATIAANGYTGVYDGNAHGGSGTATGISNEDLSSLLHFTAGFTDVPGGTVTWTFDGNNNYNSASGSAQIVISQAQATVNVTGYTGVYDGNAHGATGTATGVKGEDLSSLLNLGASFTNVPGGTANWAFAGNTNYKSANGSAAITITQADANIKVNGYTGVYDGNAHGATGNATGVKSEDLSSLLNLGASFTDVPGGTANWTFAGNTNYKSANGSAAITITQADASIKVNGYTGVYDGNPHGAAGTAAGVQGEDLSTLLNLGFTFTDVPGGTANWTFAGNTNYKSAAGSVSVVINQADASISVQGYTGVYDGNAHGATGTAIGVKAENLSSLLNLGASFTDVPGGTANWSFAGNTNYKPASGSANIIIDQASATIPVQGYIGTYDGNPHGASGTATGVKGENLSGMLNLGASFTDVPGGTAYWTFAGNGNYKAVSGSVKIVLAKADSTVTITVYGGASFTYDSTSHPATVSVTGAGGLNMPAAPLYSCGHVPTYVADSGCVASYSYAGDNNHMGSNGTVTYTIARAPLIATANSVSMVLDAPLPQLSGSLVGVLGADGITATYTTAATGTVVGAFPITPVLSDPNNRLPNYNLTSNNGTLTVQYAGTGVCYGDYGHQILPPIAANGTSTFKQGSTIPAKFRVCDALGNSISAVSAAGVPVVAQFNLIGIISGTVTQTVDQTVASTTPDTAFRWDATGQQWIFNISTKPLPIASTYVYQIVLNDGSKIQFQYGLPR